MDKMPEEVILKISSSSEKDYVKKVANAVGWQLRDTGKCKMRACKQVAVNTAVKSIAIINKKVEKAGAKFSMNACFSTTEKQAKEDSTAISIELIDVSEKTVPSEFNEYRVSGEENASEDSVTKLAGAIANPIREGKGIKLKCIGAASVYRAVKAFIVAKGYVYVNGIELACVVSWDSIPAKEEGQAAVSLLQLEIYKR